MKTRRNRTHAAILGVAVFFLVFLPMLVQLVIYIFKWLKTQFM